MYNPQIETLVQVADAGSFSKAAEKMYITSVSIMNQNKGTGKADNSMKIQGLLLISGGKTAVIFELEEQIFHKMALFVCMPVCMSGIQRMEELEKARNFIAHNRMLLPSEFQRMYMYIADRNPVIGLQNKISCWRPANP